MHKKLWAVFFVILVPTLFYLGCDAGAHRTHDGAKNTKLVGKCSLGDQGNAIKVVDSYAYIVTWDTFLIVDVSNPRTPRIVSIMINKGGIKLDVEGSYAYITIPGEYATMHIINISNPYNPTLVTTYSDWVLNKSTWGIDVVDSFAYVTAYNKLGIINVSDVQKPRRQNYIVISEGGIGGGSPEAVEVKGGLAYIAAEDSGLLIINVAKPESIYRVGKYLTEPGWGCDIEIQFPYAYLIEEYGYMWILDISEPENPKKISNFPLVGGGASIKVFESHAYVAEYFEGLGIIDISDPKNPEEVGYYGTGWGGAQGVDVKSKYAYLVTRELLIIDVSKFIEKEEQ